MTKLFLIFSHKMTPEQTNDANNTLKVNESLYLPQDLQTIWSNIEPENELDIIKLDKISTWLKNKAKKNDFVLIQGDFGAVYYLVDFCFKNSFVPIYATTKREAVEVQKNDGSIEKTQIFKHVNFRQYINYTENK